MALEDFFTLTEMKDGLSNLARVEELISLMQKQRDCVVNNVNDAARQWAAVTGTLAATESTDCLNHFVHLNGLCFLNEWIHEAQKWNRDAGDNVFEGLVTTVLAALERLPVGKDRLAVSGIGCTIERFLDHKSLSIREKSKKLYDKWNCVKIDNLSCGSENWGCVNEQSNTENGGLSITPCKVDKAEVSDQLECTATESQQSNVTRCSDSSLVDAINDVNMCMPDQNLAVKSFKSSALDAVGEMSSLGTSLISNSYPENLSVTEESTTVRLASASACSSLVCMGKDVDDQQNVSGLKKVFDVMEGTGMKESTKEDIPCKSNEKETCNNSSSSSLSASLSVEKTIPEAMISCDYDSKEGESCKFKNKEPRAVDEDVDRGMPTSFESSMDDKSAAHCTEALHNVESSQIEEAMDIIGDADHSGKEVDLKVSAVGSIRPSYSPKAVGMKNQSSEMDLEYEEIDALEMARQVAIEVEREVVDYREPFCSSPDVNSEATTGSSNPEGKQDQSVIEELDGNMSPSTKDISDNASSPKEHKSQTSDNTGTNPREHEQNSEVQQATHIVLGSVGKSDHICDFDLNEDICTEEFDCMPNIVSGNPVNLSAPIAVVATPKGAPSLPVTPLQFGGEMGWKGSAATSAFRPASSRRMSDYEKASGLKQKSNFLEIDLNVAESEHDAALDPTSVKQMPVSSGLPSGESSIEVSSRRAERLKLDLNRVGDEDTCLNPSSYWRLHHHNGDQSLSSASSSSSRQPSLRDFDLNDNPCFSDIGASHNTDKLLSKASATYGSPKLDDTVITIMGSRMAVERKDYANHAHQSFLGNGLSMMEAMIAPRPTLPYAHMPPPYAYNDHAAGPVIPIPPAFYGPGIPYIDPRGTTIVPQVLGSTGLNVASSTSPPFLTCLTGAIPGINGPGSSRSALDLNSGLTSMDSGSRDGGGFNHLFMHGHNLSVEEQSRIHAQPSGSGNALKRKEPDCGWDPYAYGYKQVTSWQ